MNRIILIGNGFDIANGLETRYSDFIIWLWKKLNSEYNSHIKESKSECIIDGLVTYIPFTSPDEIQPIDLIPKAETFINEDQTRELCKISFDNIFLRIITANFQYKNWVDIEDEYFDSLKDCLNGIYAGGIAQLNKDFDIIKTKLSEFLTEKSNEKINIQFNLANISQYFLVHDFNSIGKLEIGKDYFMHSSEETEKYNRKLKTLAQNSNYDFYTDIYPNNVLFLNFNYTDLPTKVLNYIKLNKWELNDWANTPIDSINIHGELNNHQNPMIFGYGDEQDEDHKAIEKKSGDYLNNIKTINYLKTSNYKKLLSYIESDYYQVFLFGHSCGLSDKTLLNTLFEHEHCVSIKPFYYEWEDENKLKRNNYDEIVKNIYRVFSIKTSMRDKVVPKNYCEPLAQNK